MRIISKFRDYYDVVVVHGSDKALCYVRDTREIEVKQLKLFSSVSKYVQDLYNEINVGIEKTHVFRAGKLNAARRVAIDTSDFDEAIIGFCGKLFPTIQFHSEWMTHPSQFLGVLQKLSVQKDNKTGCLHDDVVMLKKQFEQTGRKYTPHNSMFGRQPHQFTREWFEGLLQVYGNGVKVPLDFFFEINAPVFVWVPHRYGGEKEKVIINPCLRDYKFQSLVEPFTAWQEISMFVGGVLNRPTAPMVSISDEIRRDKKGFDERSFKNMPRRE